MSSGGGEAAAVSVIVVAVAAADYMQDLVYNRRRRAEAEQPASQGADAGGSDAAAPVPQTQPLPQKAKEVLLGYFGISPAELASLTGYGTRHAQHPFCSLLPQPCRSSRMRATTRGLTPGDVRRLFLACKWLTVHGKSQRSRI